MRSRKVPVTRKQVADAAGVSTTTVRNVLANFPQARISPRVRSRVLETVKRLKYKPSFSASSLAAGRTHIIGLMVPGHVSLFRGYYLRMMQALVAAMEEKEDHVLVLQREPRRKYLDCIRRKLLDGMVILQSDQKDEATEAVLTTGLPTVLLNRLGPFSASAVSMDYAGVVERAVEFLYGRRRRRIALLCPYWDCEPNLRHINACHACQENPDFQDAHIRHFDIPREDRTFAATAADIVRGDWDGIIVDGLAAAGRCADLTAETGDRDIVAIDVGDAPFTDQRIARLWRARPDEMANHAYRELRRLIDQPRARPKTILIPFSQESPC